MSAAAALSPRLIALQGLGSGAARLIATQGIWPIDEQSPEPGASTGSGGWSVRTPSVPVNELLRLLKTQKRRRDRKKRRAEELLLLGLPH